MKKLLSAFWGILTVASVSVIIISMIYIVSHWKKQEYAVNLCVTEKTAVKMAETAVLIEKGEYDAEDVGMQIVYQLAKRSVVKVIVKDSAGSGLIWKLDDAIVVVSNKHLLMNDVQAEIVFGNGESVNADIIGYSQQYDIGFVRISEGVVTGSTLRDIYEVVPLLYETVSETANSGRILQVGAAIDKNMANCSTGSIVGLRFVPLFNTEVLETACFSRAGMSGGGVFDEGGRLLGMISGGEVPEEFEERKAEITYSIPTPLIASEYEAIGNHQR